MSQASLPDLDTRWQRVVQEFAQHAAPSPAVAEFFRPGVDRVSLVGRALRLAGGNRRAAAIALLREMDVAERQELFPELVQLARAAHGPVGAVRGLILALPRAWAKDRIEAEVEPALQEEEYDDYWTLLAPFEQLDVALARRLAQRAAAHRQPDIRELGQAFLERLTRPSGE
jgi:hypothetical protein